MTGRRRAPNLFPILALLAAAAVLGALLQSRDRDEMASRTEAEPAAENGREDRTRAPEGKLVATGLTEPPEPTPMTECMLDQGWGTVPYDGTTRGYLPNSPIPPEEQLGYLKAERFCLDRTGTDDREVPRRAQLERAYRGVLATERCLEDEGYEVVETPNIEEFVEVRGAWNPHASLVAPDLGYIGDGEYVRLEVLCPNPQSR